MACVCLESGRGTSTFRKASDKMIDGREINWIPPRVENSSYVSAQSTSGRLPCIYHRLRGYKKPRVISRGLFLDVDRPIPSHLGNGQFKIKPISTTTLDRCLIAPKYFNSRSITKITVQVEQSKPSLKLPIYFAKSTTMMQRIEF